MKTQKRRRRQGLTNYHKRLNLLKSEKPRLVVRKTNRYIIAQYVISENAQDKILIGFDSKILTKYGWPTEFINSLKSVPASYLSGYLMGKMIIKNKYENPIIDFGIQRVIHKSRLFSFIKGLNDAGLKIKCKKEHFPEENRIKGKHLKKDFSKYFEKIKNQIDKM